MSSELNIAPCGSDAVRYAVEHWHYSKSVTPPPRVDLGVWERGKFVGCVIFARGAAASLLAPYGLETTEGAELVRVALTAHATPTSRVVAVAIRVLRRLAPGLRLLVSFADPRHGHVGGIYQAGGWTYAGKTDAGTAYVGPDGKLWHSRMISASGRKRVFGIERSVLRPSDCTAIAMPGKHRYLMPLDDEMRARIAPLSLPYPKRARSIEADEYPSPVGGEAPTRALHLPEASHAAS